MIDYNIIYKVLLTPAEDYLDDNIRNVRHHNKALWCIHEASKDILDYFSHITDEPMKHDKVLVLHLVQYPSREMKRYWRMGDSTVHAINDALMRNGLFLDMHPDHIEAILQNCKRNQEMELPDVLLQCIKKMLFAIKDNGGFSINLGQTFFPGYECSLTFNKK